jgi:hypothetical protein
MIGAAIERHSTLDVLVNNAGIMDRFLPAAETPDELWERVLKVNLTGPFLATKRAIGPMLEGGSGVIVNIASVSGLRGGAAGAAYTASKHGLIGLTKNTAANFATEGIRCVAICPGGVDTGISPGESLESGIRHVEPRPSGHGAPGQPHRDSRRSHLLRFGGGLLSQRCGDRGRRRLDRTLSEGKNEFGRSTFCFTEEPDASHRGHRGEGVDRLLEARCRGHGRILRIDSTADVLLTMALRRLSKTVHFCGISGEPTSGLEPLTSPHYK